MTIEEKAKAYDEALEKGRIFRDHLLETGDKGIAGEIEYIFPELVESKDEKIRKALIRFHKSTIDVDGIKGDDIIAWLEKQGEQPSAIRWYDVSLIPQEMEELLVEWDSEDATWHEVAFYHADTKTFWNGTRQVENVTRWCYIIDLLEKQGEQKPVIDFKASNWYVSKVDGKIHDMTYNPTDKVEPKFKVKYAGSEYNVLEVKDIAGVTFYGIEDEPNHIDYVQADNCEIISGYAIKENGSSYPTNPAVFSEQKPFDYENVNIQQKDFASVGETATIELSSPIDCGDRIYHVSHKPIEKNGEQKPAWSEEDENYLQNAENAFEYQNSKNSSTILWLKSLKNRVQHQEWSEEDEVELDNAIYACLNFYGKDSDTADWLKSIKDRIGG